MYLEMRGERIESLLHQWFVGHRACGRAEPGEPCRALCVTGEEAMQVGAGDAAIGRDSAVRPAVIELHQRMRCSRSRGPADMHLVTADSDIVGHGTALDRVQRFVADQFGLDLDQAE